MADLSNIPVLVPQADALGMLAVIRSLGRAGFQVHACSKDASALGLHSKLASYATVSPSYASADYIPWLREYIKQHAVRAIVPSEGFLLAIMDQLEEFLPLMPNAAERDTLVRCFSKAETLEHFREQGGPNLAKSMPAFAVVRSAADIAEIDAYLPRGGPFFVKADAVLGRTGPGPGAVRQADQLAQARQIATELLGEYSAVLIQAPAIGRKATVNIFLNQGEVIARSMCLSTHESPHTGGLTVLRHTWWHDAMYADALERLRCLQWDGVAMVEYKWDAATQSYQFIEANTRYWAALHLDLFAGTDFPAIQLRKFLGQRDATQIEKQTLGVVSRHTVPGEIGHLLTTVRDPAVGILKKLKTFTGFCLLFMHPGIHRDLLFPGDRALYWRQWRRFIAELGKPGEGQGQ